MLRNFLTGILISSNLVWGEPVTIRVVAANLSADRNQSYSPDNGNHSNPEGAGARILAALKPDIVLIQEFNTAVPPRQWVNKTLGGGFSFLREDGMQIPNGIISRFPILASGSWNDPVIHNRQFAWAHLRLPESRDLWAVSVHLHSKGEASRAQETSALAGFLRANVPQGSLLVIGGDFNTRSDREPCFERLAGLVLVPNPPPADEHGNASTNAPRNHPYDWVLASDALQRCARPLELAGRRFPNGLVFDTRIFTPLAQCPPAQPGDSAVPFMQHMAVVREFQIP